MRYLDASDLKRYINVPFHFRACTANTNDVRCWLLERLNRRAGRQLRVERLAHNRERRSGIH